MGNRVWLSANGELDLDIGPSNVSPVNNPALHLRELPVCIMGRSDPLRCLGLVGFDVLFGSPGAA